MARIPTLIPQHLRDWVGGLFSGPVLDVLWRLFLIALGAVVIYAMVASPYFLATFVAGIILTTFLADDIQQAALDVWNRNFWVWRVGSVLLAAALIGVPVAGGALSTGPGVASASSYTVYEIDADHALVEENSIETYESEGAASTSLTTPRMNVTIAEQASACGVDQPFVSDVRNDYLCLDYQEDVPATVRLNIPEAYWHPYIRESKAPVTDGPRATLDPVTVDNESYTSVRATFEGQTNAVYAIPEDATASYALLERANERVAEVAGFRLWSKGTEWQTVSGEEFGQENATIRLNVKDPSSTLIQYDLNPEPGSETWVTVPDSQDHHAPVYRMQRDGVEGVVYIVAEDSNPPQIRYRHQGNSPLARVDRIADSISKVPDKLMDRVDSWSVDIPFIGGDESGGGA